MLPLTVRVRTDFGENAALVGPDLTCPEAWDALRLAGGPYGFQARELPTGLEQRMRSVHEHLPADWTIASYGVGAGLAEQCLLALGRTVVVSDYAPRTVKQLTHLFPAVAQHDLLRDPPLSADVHFFHRIETEFSNRDFQAVFDRFRDQRVLLVTAGIGGWRHLSRTWLHAHLRPSATRTGWTRNRAGLQRLWRPTHTGSSHRFHDATGWLLYPIAIQ